MITIECKECGARFEGERAEARRAGWEPFSTATQHALDRGPMVCPDCVTQLLDDVLDAMRKWFILCPTVGAEEWS